MKPLTKLPPLKRRTDTSEPKKAPLKKIGSPASVPSRPVTKLAPKPGVVLPMSPARKSLAKEVRETREEQIEKIEEEVQKAPQILPVSPRAIKPISVKGVEGLSLKKLKPLEAPLPKEKAKGLPKVSKIPKLPSSTNLTLAQEGVEEAKLAEPQAAFQPSKIEEGEVEEGEVEEIKPTKLKPLDKKKTVVQPVSDVGVETKKKSLPKLAKPTTTKLPTTINRRSTKPSPGLKVLSFETLSEEASGELSSVGSVAKLPTQKTRGAPKIKIPKIQASPVRPTTPATSKIAGVDLPKQTTTLAPVPIISPTPIRRNVVSAKIPAQDLSENIKKIDTTKLSAERKGRGAAYSVAELKGIAGSLNLTKSGSKKDLVERIKAAILRVNPSAQFE